MAYAKIRPRRGTRYEWDTYNPILAEGELAIEFPDTGIGTGLCKFKVGDGVSPWTILPYAFDGTAAVSIDGGGVNPTALIQIRTASANAWFNANPILTTREIAYCSDEDINSIKIGDGSSRWNQLSYIKASGLIENDKNFDFGSEDAEGDNVMSLSEMEDYITANGNYAPTAFENYGDPEPVNAQRIVASNRERTYNVDVPEGTSTAGLSDLLTIDEDEVVEAPKEDIVDSEDTPETEDEKVEEEVVEEEKPVEEVEEEKVETKSSKKSKSGSKK